MLPWRDRDAAWTDRRCSSRTVTPPKRTVKPVVAAALPWQDRDSAWRTVTPVVAAALPWEDYDAAWTDRDASGGRGAALAGP